MSIDKKICGNCGKMIDFNITCECIIAKQRLDNNDRKRGKPKKEYEKAIHTKRWRDLRKVIIERDGSICQRCYYKYNIVNGTQMQVHHILPRSKYPDLIFEESNLITLCKTCNIQLDVEEKLDFEIVEKEIEYNL